MYFLRTFEVLTSVKIHIVFLWAMTVCCIVIGGDQHIRGMHCFIFEMK